MLYYFTFYRVQLHRHRKEEMERKLLEKKNLAAIVIQKSVRKNIILWNRFLLRIKRIREEIRQIKYVIL